MITEIPLPSSVIEQLEQNNIYSPVQGPVTPTGVMIQTAPTIHIQVPKPGIVKNHLIESIYY